MHAWRRKTALLACLATIAAAADWAGAPPGGKAISLRSLLWQKTVRRSRRVARRFDGVMGIGVRDLTSGQAWYHHGGEVFPTASTIKTTLLFELLHLRDQHRIRLATQVRIEHAETVGGSGLLYHLGNGTTTMSLGDLAVAMVQLSDNSATNLLIARAGMERVNREMRKLGLRHTALRRKMMDEAAARAGRENVSTPRDLLRLLRAVYQGKVLTPASRALYLHLLELPSQTGTMLSRGVPPGVKVADKPGELEHVRCDCGLVLLPRRPYELCVFTSFDRSGRQGGRAITQVSRLWYRYFHRVAISSRFGRAIYQGTPATAVAAPRKPARAGHSSVPN